MTNSSAYNYNLGLEFYRVADQNQNRPALRHPDGETVDFAALNALSNQLAHLLLERGLKRGDVIAIFNDKSTRAFALMLACLKTGIVYTNLDPGNPWARLDKIIQTCAPKMVCFDGVAKQLESEIRKSHRIETFLALDDAETIEALSRYPSGNLEISKMIDGHSPAYIMFTSGSTGFPKGAVMSHDNVLNFIRWSRETFRITPDDVLTNVNPIYFDNSVFDFYAAIYNGASVVPVSAAITKNAASLVRTVNERKCTLWFSVPSMLVYLLINKALTKKDFPSVTRISFGGEGFPKNKLKELYTLFADRMAFFNVYGPTECTCICSSYLISQADFENMNELAPLGSMAPNFDYRILPADTAATKAGAPAPTRTMDQAGDAVGELALLGPCVGLGYYHDPERTSKSFVQEPSANFRRIMYKTGDLVSLAPDGKIHFKGRVDNQIKHMGYRIELEEIEAAFSSLPYIGEAGVIYDRATPEIGFIRAFVTLSVSGPEPANRDAKSILEDIKNLLPPYMLPKSIAVMEVLPKNANGKIDRKQLKEHAS